MLQVNQPTDEQVEQEKTQKESLQNSLHDSLKGTPIQKEILKDLGLSPEVEEEPVKKQVKKEEKVEEEVVEETTDETTEETTEEKTSDDKQEEEEEVIPKSKVQKRFDELTARLKAQERELEELKASKSEPKDDVTKQLEAMTTEQLKAAKMEVRKAQITAKDDDTKLNEYLALEDKIDSALQNAPKRFQEQQETALRKMAERLSPTVNDIEKVGPSIMKLAQEIYQKYPLLHKDVNGQATALEMAVEHHKIISSTVKTGDKTKETELQRQVNTLKKKTTLDTKSTKTEADKVSLEKMRKAAIGGTTEQKVALIKSHPMFNVDAMIPDEFKGR